MERIILLRHAESAYSAKNVVNGDPYVYVPLTRTGRRQAKRLREELADDPIDLCVTSRFPRTRETADIALEGRPIPRLVLEQFDDVKMGSFEGGLIDQVREFQREHGPAAPLPGGGESRVESVARFLQGYRALLGREEPVILLVSHGLPITMVALAVRGEGVPDTLEGIQAEPAVPYRYTADDLAAAVRRLGEWVREAGRTR